MWVKVLELGKSFRSHVVSATRSTYVKPLWAGCMSPVRDVGGLSGHGHNRALSKQKPSQNWHTGGVTVETVDKPTRDSSCTCSPYWTLLGPTGHAGRAAASSLCDVVRTLWTLLDDHVSQPRVQRLRGNSDRLLACVILFFRSDT